MNRRLKKIRKAKQKEIRAIRNHFRPEVYKAAAYSVGSDFRSLEVTAKTARRLPLLVEIRSVLWPDEMVLHNFEPMRVVRELCRRGHLAGALVATDERFLGGNPGWINLLKYNTDISVLQRDFYFDPVQIYQAKAIGADAVVIDLEWSEVQQVPALVEAAFEMGLEAFLKVADPAMLREVPVDGVSGVFFPLPETESGRLNFPRLQTLLDVAPRNVLKMAVGYPGNASDVARLVASGVQALMLDDRLWRVPRFAEAFQQISRWSMQYPLQQGD